MQMTVGDGVYVKRNSTKGLSVGAWKYIDKEREKILFGSTCVRITFV